MKKRARSVAMLASGLIILGLIGLSPDILPPAAVAGLILVSFALIAGGMRSPERDRSVSA